MQRIGRYFIVFALGLAALCIASSAWALPRNFRNVDTFYVGAMPSVEDIDEFKVLGIQSIVSLHRLPEDVKKRAKKHGMKLYNYPLRTRLLKVEEIMQVLKSEPANTVYVHCLHGADRTGAITAYWLTTERQVDPFTALATVISPQKLHLRGLQMLGREYGVSLLSTPPRWVGRYSGAKNGGLEGLKICGDQWYTKLARNYLAITMGPPLEKPVEKFWEQKNAPKLPR
ncbi:MAG: tyrosine-protein phosphatase [Bradymonadales bacterium]|jgi:protein tyrosine phosphatase (PTP) superfamily phosphohydrolase (DUF442 family)